MKDLETTILNGIAYTRKGDGLFFYDQKQTYLHLIRQNISRETLMNLSFAKEIITDSKYPESGKIWLDPIFVEPQCFEDGEGYIHYGDSLQYGRKVLVEMINDYQYYDALPQIKKILEFGSSKMKSYVLRELSDFPRRAVNQLVAETFPKEKNDPNINDYLHYVSTYPDPIFERNLMQTFEIHEINYFTGINDFEVLSGILRKILYACGEIYTIKSIEIIEKALNYKYEYIRRFGRVSLIRWLEGVVVLKNPDKKLIQKATRVAEIYNVDTLFKKES